MELSFYSVISHQGTPVAVILLGSSGSFLKEADQVSTLPEGARTFVRRILDQLQTRPSVVKTNALRERLGDGPTQLSELRPVSFHDPQPTLEALAERFLR